MKKKGWKKATAAAILAEILVLGLNGCGKMELDNLKLENLKSDKAQIEESLKDILADIFNGEKKEESRQEAEKDEVETEEAKNGKAESQKTEAEETEAGSLSTDCELSVYLVRAQSEKNGKYGYIDVRTGHYVIEPEFADADVSFGEDGWARVRNENDEQTVINTEGTPLFDFGSIGYVYEYEGDAMLVSRSDTECLLYHGSSFIKELEVPVENVKNFGPSWGYRGKSGSGDFYEPERYLVIKVENKAGDYSYVWYDKDGNYIYTADDVGGLAGDDQGYYHFSQGKLIIMDPDKNIVEESFCGSPISAVVYEGDNWYVYDSLGENEKNAVGIYTNGLKLLVSVEGRNGWGITANDGIVTADARYFREDGSLLYESSGVKGWYGFENGYAKMIAGGRESGFNYCGFIDTEGNECYPLEYEEMENYSEVLPGGYLAYKKEDLWGIKDMQENIVAEPMYTSIFDMK
ncbi:MAG: WG repeat-containing protein [Lachnospiraceae bacterium]|nr:WG repeat-containing protein [Lachnospiraceae bacterium]